MSLNILFMKKWLLFNFLLIIFVGLSKTQEMSTKSLPTNCSGDTLCFSDVEELTGDTVYDDNDSYSNIYYKEGSVISYGSVRYVGKNIYMQDSKITINYTMRMVNSHFYLYSGENVDTTLIGGVNSFVSFENTTIHLVKEDVLADFNVDFSKINSFDFIGGNDFSIDSGDVSSLPTIDLSEYSSNDTDIVTIGQNITFSNWIRIVDGVEKIDFAGNISFENVNLVFDGLYSTNFVVPMKTGLKAIYFSNGTDLSLTFDFERQLVLDNFYLDKSSRVDVITSDFSTQSLYVKDSGLTLSQSDGVLTIEDGGVLMVTGDSDNAQFVSESLVTINQGIFYASGTKGVQVDFNAGIDFTGNGMNTNIDGSVSREDYDFLVIGSGNTLNSQGSFSISDSNMLFNDTVNVTLDGLNALNMERTYLYINDSSRIDIGVINAGDEGTVEIRNSYLHIDNSAIYFENQVLNISNSEIYAVMDSEVVFVSSVINATNVDIILEDNSIMSVEDELSMTGGSIQAVDIGVQITINDMSLNATSLYINDDLEFKVDGETELKNVTITKVISEDTQTSLTSFNVSFVNLHLSGNMYFNIDIKTDNFVTLNGKYPIFGYTDLQKDSDFQIIFSSSSVLLNDQLYLDEDVKALIYDIQGFVEIEDLEKEYQNGTNRRKSTFNFLSNVRDMVQDGLGQDGISLLTNILVSNSQTYEELDKTSHSLMANTSNSFMLFNSSTFDKIEIFEKGINHFDYRGTTDIMFAYSSAKETYWSGSYITAGLASLLSKSGAFKYGLGVYYSGAINEESHGAWKEDVQGVLVSLFGYQIQNNYQFGFAISGMYSYVNGIKSNDVFDFMDTEEVADYLERSYNYVDLVTNISFYYSIVSLSRTMPMAFKSTFQVSGMIAPSVFFQEDGNTNVSHEVTTPDFQDIYFSYTLTPVQILKAGEVIMKYNMGIKYHFLNNAGGNAVLLFSKGFGNSGYTYYYDDIAPFEAFVDLKVQTNHGLSLGFSFNKRGSYVNNYIYINYRIKGIGFY